MRLYRAAEQSTTEGLTFWADDIEHARKYTHMPGFGGSILYETDVDATVDQILDLTVAP